MEWTETKEGTYQGIEGNHRAVLGDQTLLIFQDEKLFKTLSIESAMVLHGMDSIEFFDNSKKEYESEFEVILSGDIDVDFRIVKRKIEEYVNTLFSIPRAFIGGNIDLSFVHRLQDCIFESAEKYNRANYFYQTVMNKINTRWPTGILAEIQENCKGIVSYVTWDLKGSDKSNILIKQFSDTEYEGAVKWMSDTIMRVKKEAV